jgi:uptake hydrogenase large subunit
MNAAAGLSAIGPGALAITVQVAGGEISAVRVASTRPTNLARLLVDRASDEAPLLAERIFSLCGVSHRVVAARAIAAARGEAICARRVQGEAIALHADRVSGALRSTMILALQGSRAALDAGRIRPLGEILALARDLSALTLAKAVPLGSNRMAVKTLIRTICALGREHALPARWGGLIQSHADSSLFAILEGDFADCVGFAAKAPDVLDAMDDAEILEHMRRQAAAFAAAPSLLGRVPETGSFARCWRDADFTRGALATRFEARMIDLAESFDLLERAEKDEGVGASAVSPRQGEGFAVAETSRGRLYHWVRLARDDRILDYQIVAPTEWNFHPAGPFVAALTGSAIPKAEIKQRVVQLAGLMDPCVPFRVNLKESVRA